MDVSDFFSDLGYPLTGAVAKRNRAKDTTSEAATGMLRPQKASELFGGNVQIGSPGDLADEKIADSPWRILFQTADVPEPEYVRLEILGPALIGRADPSDDTQPELDLTPLSAHANGVSRRHAVLVPTDEGIFLVDLDSVNGTWLSGKYLQPGQKYPLHSGDVIELGLLKLVVRVIIPATWERSIRATVQARNKPLQH